MMNLMIFKIIYFITIFLQVTFKELNKIDHHEPTAAQTRFPESRIQNCSKCLREQKYAEIS